MKVRDEKAFCENCSWSLCSADKMDNNDYRFLTILYSDTLFSILIGGRSATNNYDKFVLAITRGDNQEKCINYARLGLHCPVICPDLSCGSGEITRRGRNVRIVKSLSDSQVGG